MISSLLLILYNSREILYGLYWDYRIFFKILDLIIYFCLLTLWRSFPHKEIGNHACSKWKYFQFFFWFQNPFTSARPGTKDSTASIEYPGWGIFIAVFFTIVSMVPIILWLGYDLYKNPGAWKAGFIKKFTNSVELHPDPVRMDPSRRKTTHEIESEILKEFEQAGLNQ